MTTTVQHEKQGHRDLDAWNAAMELVTELYRISTTFPPDERFGLVSQLRRAAVSVPSNLAEGYGRVSTRDFHRFIGQAHGSLLEVETQLEIAKNLGYITADEMLRLSRMTRRVAQLLYGLKNWCERNASSPN